MPDWMRDGGHDEAIRKERKEKKDSCECDTFLKYSSMLGSMSLTGTNISSRVTLSKNQNVGP
jgi:hypothetical protein